MPNMIFWDKIMHNGFTVDVNKRKKINFNERVDDIY